MDAGGGRAYFNIHTVMFPGGEIRGHIAVPEPVTLLLLLGGLAAATLRSRSIRGRTVAAKRAVTLAPAQRADVLLDLPGNTPRREVQVRSPPVSLTGDPGDSSPTGRSRSVSGSSTPREERTTR